MRCPNCQYENPSVARFCSNCGLNLQNRCPNCRAELAPGARFCMYCGQSLRARSPLDEARFIQLAQAAPAPLVEKAKSSQLTGERRVVTVLFADVVGSTTLSEKLGNDRLAEVISGAFQAVTPAIYRYEGTIARLLGDSLIAFFGAPVAHEDDPQRAVRAALDMIIALREYAAEVESRFQVRFAMRACLNSGTVLVGPVSDDLRYEYTATGGTVNLAARVKFVAEPMTVTLTEDTARFVRPFFEIVPVGDIRVEDRAQMVKVFKVIGIKDQPGKARGVSGLHSSLVGREAQLETLLVQCDLVRAGLGRVSLVVGEPGIGKTRLVEEWKNLVLSGQHGTGRPPLWVEGRCVSYGGGMPYHLLNDLLHNMTGTSLNSREDESRAALNRLVHELLGNQPGDEASTQEILLFLSHLLGMRLEPDDQRRIDQLEPQALQTQYLKCLRKIVLALTARRPLVIVLEDIQWADPSSVDILGQLLPLVFSEPLLFCLVTREDPGSAGWQLVTMAREALSTSLVETRLEPLSERETRQLVANLLEVEALSKSARDLILKKAEGNPFFVEEVIRMLIERDVIQSTEHGWVTTGEIDPADIPDNLQSLLLARIDRLPEDVRHTLRVAAVIGRRFPVRVLQEVLSMEQHV